MSWTSPLHFSRWSRQSLYVLFAGYAIIANAFIITPEVHPRHPIVKGLDLRVLPLGDSITWGQGSSDGNGYRLALATMVRADGNNITYIGQVESGNMTNNQNEGHRGFRIDPIGDAGKPDFPERPNVVLLMAGTNDIIVGADVPNAPERLGTVIGDAVAACPDAAVLVGTLLPLVHPKDNPQLTSNDTEAFNTGLQDVVKEYEHEGRQVAVVNMTRVTDNYINATDGTHPTDEGYALIAAAWHDGLVAASEKGWIQKPLLEPSGSQPNGTSEQNGKPPVGSTGSANSNSKTTITIWSLQKTMFSVLILFGVI
ncbi:MAG: hypothetical protein Q9218_003337 [Villophora microphyllina]